MKSNASILILALAASAAFAQTAPAPAKASAAATKPAVAAPASKPAAVSVKPTSAKPASAAPVKAAPAKAVPAVAQVKKTVKKKAAPDASASSAKPVVKTASGKRDPFVSPIQSRTTASSPCPSGKKCLAPGEVRLMGVVKSQNGMIALVENPAKKSYSLRENDPVLNGYVVKITLDSIIFKETTQDRLGKSMSREVVKKLTVPVV